MEYLYKETDGSSTKAEDKSGLERNAITRRWKKYGIGRYKKEREKSDRSNKETKGIREAAT